MTLQEIIARLAKIDEEVRAATTVDAVEKLSNEKKDLLERKADMEALEQRKQTALNLSAGTQSGRILEVRQPMIVADFAHMSPEEVRATDAYRTGFMKRLLGRELNDIEKRANEMGSTDVAGVIPTTTSSTIFSLLKQYAPLLGEVTLFRIPGNVTIAVEKTNNDAALHTQNAAITPAADAMDSVTLAGFEIVKALRISATVSKMAISAFETWLTEYLGRKIASKIGQYLIYGTGSSQPKGIDYMATWTDGTNAVDWASTSPTAAEHVELVSYLKAGYHNGAKFLMNAKTFWGKVVAVQDNSKFKILTDDYSRLLGYPVLLDDNTLDDDIFFGNFREGIIANLSQDVTVDASPHSGFLYNAIDYRGTAIFDCDLTHTEGFVKSAPTLTAGA